MKGILMNRIKVFLIAICLVLIGTMQTGYGQSRVGTTAASFLEIGIGPRGAAMGDAFVSGANDLTSIYWNPAGLALMEKNEVIFSHQPWIANINNNFVCFPSYISNRIIRMILKICFFFIIFICKDSIVDTNFLKKILVI